MTNRKTVKTTTAILAVVGFAALMIIQNAAHIGILNKMTIIHFIFAMVALFLVCIATGGPAIILGFWLLTHHESTSEAEKKTPVG